MGSEDEVVGCIGERKVKRDGELRGWQYKWHLIFCMDSTIIFKRTNVLVKNDIIIKSVRRNKQNEDSC